MKSIILANSNTNSSTKLKFHFLIVGLLTLITLTLPVQAGVSLLSDKNTLSLQNLERERAALVQDILNPELDVQTRINQLKKRQRHLTDMERMVMRDERLLHSNADFVKRAFDNYETTFLVHAGAEQKRSASEQWLASIKISNADIMNTQVGYRK